jgi:hypothetical protein
VLESAIKGAYWEKAWQPTLNKYESVGVMERERNWRETLNPPAKTGSKDGHEAGREMVS